MTPHKIRDKRINLTDTETELSEVKTAKKQN